MDQTTSDDLASEVPLRLTRARIQVERGNVGEAEKLIDQTFSLLEGTDDPNARADVLLTHARVLRAAGKADDAVSAVEEALRFSE